MYIYLIFPILILIALSFLNKKISLYINSISYLLFKSTAPGIYFYFLLFLPGIIIHELSHFLTALILLVKVGDIRLSPVKDDKKYILGQVSYAQTDPLRTALIASAPLILGSLIIFIIVSIFLNVSSFTSFSTLVLPPLNIFFIYLVICLTNTMFLSNQDKKGLLVIPFLIILPLLILYFFNRLNFIQIIALNLIPIAKTLSLSYLIGFIFNFLFFIFSYFIYLIISNIKKTLA